MEPNDIRKLFTERDATIDRLNGVLEGKISAAQKELMIRFLQDFGDKLEFDENGVIKNNAANRNLLQRIDKIFGNWAAENNTAVLNTLLTGVNGLMNFNERYYSNFAGEANILPLKKKVLKNINGWLGIGDNGGAAANGYLETLVANADVRNKLKDFAVRSIYGQQGYQDTKANLAKLIGGDKDNLGALQKYYRNFTYDLYSQIDRATAETYANDLGFVFAIYEGGLIETSREFCQKHNGKIFHKTEIAAFKLTVAEPPNYNPFTDLGGYGCRHHLNYIPNALAVAMRPDARKFLTGAGEKEIAAQSKPEPSAVDKKIDKLAEQTAAELKQIGRPPETIYRDLDAQSVAGARTTAQLQEEMGRPISTERIFGKINKPIPEPIAREISLLGKADMDGLFKETGFKEIDFENISISQQFVFETPLKNSTGKEIWGILSGGKVHIIDGNHSLTKAFLNGEKSVNVKLLYYNSDRGFETIQKAAPKAPEPDAVFPFEVRSRLLDIVEQKMPKIYEEFADWAYNGGTVSAFKKFKDYEDLLRAGGVKMPKLQEQDFTKDLNEDKLNLLSARGFDVGSFDRKVEYFNKNLKGFDIEEVDNFLDKSFKEFGATSVIKELRFLDDAFSFKYTASTPHGTIEISRGFTEKRGKNGVYHALLSLPKSLQGNGFTKKFFKELVKQYEAAGIEIIEVTANIDVGGYAWGRYGFSSDDKMMMGEIAARAKNKLNPEQLKEYDKWYKAGNKDKVWNMNELSNFPWAKNLLLNTYWRGFLDLKNPVQAKIFKDYLNK